MNPHVAAAITQSRVIGIVREGSAAAARAQVRRLVSSGVRVIEVSLGTPGGMDVIEWMTEEYAGSGVCCGAGTVLTAAELSCAASARAEFIVSPIATPELTTAARDRGLLGVFGAMTPTECFQAASNGSEFVKLFPARNWTCAGVRDLLQALPELKLVPTGGVSLADAADWLGAGAVAVGLGGALRKETSGPRLQAMLSALAGTPAR